MKSNVHATVYLFLAICYFCSFIGWITLGDWVVASAYLALAKTQ